MKFLRLEFFLNRNTPCIQGVFSEDHNAVYSWYKNMCTDAVYIHVYPRLTSLIIFIHSIKITIHRVMQHVSNTDYVKKIGATRYNHYTHNSQG